MPYVYRDGNSKISGWCTGPDGTDEFLPDDHPELVAFKNPPPRQPADKVRAQANASPVIRALVSLLAEMRGVTPQEVINDLAGRV